MFKFVQSLQPEVTNLKKFYTIRLRRKRIWKLDFESFKVLRKNAGTHFSLIFLQGLWLGLLTTFGSLGNICKNSAWSIFLK